jgi:plasmid maintenance system antidote protein VapI
MRLRSRDLLIVALEDLAISERELARRADLSHSTVNHLVTARRQTCSLRTAVAIERHLALDPGALFEPETTQERRLLAEFARSSDRKRPHKA